MKAIIDGLRASRERISLLCPDGVSPEKVIAGAIKAIEQNPQIAKCEPASVILAVIHAAELGLEPTGAVGGAHLVPYKTKNSPRPKCQLIVDYRGMIHLAEKAGWTVTAHLIHENDEFEVSFGTDQKIIHKPHFPRGNVVGAYAMAKRGGDVKLEVMDKEELERIRKRSASSSGPWKTDPEEMFRKTVVRRLFKYLPHRVLRRTTEVDEAVMVNQNPNALGNGLTALCLADSDPSPQESAPLIENRESEDENRTKGRQKPTSVNKAKITKAQHKRLWAIAHSEGVADQLKKIVSAFGYERTDEVTRSDYDDIVEAVQNAGRFLGRSEKEKE